MNFRRAGHRLPLSVSENDMNCLIETDAFRHAAQLLARNLVAIYSSAPRTAGLFASQQRWFLCHAALAHHFRALDNREPGLTRRAIGNLARQFGVSSRNTAYAFFDEALKYGVIRPVQGDDSVAARLVEPSLETLSLLKHWYFVHFQALDVIDDGDRAARFAVQPDSVLAIIQQSVSPALLTNQSLYHPGPLYTIFTWADSGGLLMDRLIAGMDHHENGEQSSFLTDVSAISHLAQSFGLSRAHASRKLAAAEAIGGVGWNGVRGRSRIWISRGFYVEYARAMANKLAILDEAFAEVCERLMPVSENANQDVCCADSQ
ncbi:hypothetical protein ABUK73_06260 [Agrobacterium sp. BA1120]|uniref:hypothetical protein n=1 Tax=Agrobacterium sp. BA1120 TaxID=3228927 RepID=UPI00336A3383